MPAAWARAPDAAPTSAAPDADGWVAACDEAEVAPGDMLGFHVGNRSFAVYHAADDGLWYATAGKCTHGAGVLADGLVVEGTLVECPKHNGCFDFKTGNPKRLPVTMRLATYATRVEAGTVYVQVAAGRGLQLDYDKEED